jgi:hypothetical protein
MRVLGNESRGVPEEDPVDAAWAAVCAQLEASAVAVVRKFTRTPQAHLSFTEVHDLAQLVDLAWDGQPLDPDLVEFATQRLVQVAERAARTHFRPKYFSDYKCLEALWAASAVHERRPMTRGAAQTAS